VPKPVEIRRGLWSVDAHTKEQIDYAALDAHISERIYASAHKQDRQLTRTTAVAGVAVDMKLASLVICARGVVREANAWKGKVPSGWCVVEVKEVLAPGARTLAADKEGVFHALQEYGPEKSKQLLLWRILLLSRQ
jgi:hypothetical protein